MSNTHDTLAELLQERKKTRDILLVSHAVLGYPSFAANRESISIMAETDTDIIELQIPFSDPLADGPFFTHANEQSVRAGTKVVDCFEFAREIIARHRNTTFVFMTYYNIMYRYGVEQFVADAAAIGIRGIIIPDLPLIEEGTVFLHACDTYGLAGICMVTPETTPERMREIARIAKWFLYVQARAGVTWSQTTFDAQSERYLQDCHRIFNIPLAVGFGITRPQDVEYLVGRAEIAICCTRAVQVYTEEWAERLREFLLDLRKWSA